MSVSNRIASLTPEQRALFELLRQKQQRKTSGGTHQPPPIRRLSGPAGEGDWPLSYDQERLWFLYFLDPESTANNMISAVRLNGPLHIPALARTLTEIVRRHGAWRTTFPMVDGQPVQRVTAEPRVALPVVDLTALPEERREPAALGLLDDDTRHPFSLEVGPLLRLALVRLADRSHICWLSVHHIVNDWVSFQIFWRELAMLYDAFSSGRALRLPELPAQYSDFAAWQREWMSGEVLQDYLDWWQQQLEGFPRFLDLPEDRPRPAAGTARGGRLPVRMDGRLTDELRALAQREGATRFMVVMALCATLFHRLSGQERIVVGTLNANRNRPEIEPVFGYFLTQLPFPIDLSGDPPFRELLARVRKVALGAYAHQELPFGKLVEAMQPERNLSRQPLVQTLVQLLDAQSAFAGEMSELQLQPFEVQDDNARYDVMIALYEFEHAIGGPLEYNADVFDATTAGRMLDLLYRTTEAAMRNPGARLSELPAFSEAARQQVLVEWNDTWTSASTSTAGEPETVVELFAAQAARTPAAVAWSGDGWSLDYARLDERSNRLARRLRRLGAVPGELVGIYLERTAELPVTLLGILKSGAAYLPLDLAHPAERRAFMVEEARPVVVLTQEHLLPGLPEGTRTLLLDAGSDPLADESGEPIVSGADPEDRAYVIYTSGSTGRPKGVEIPHRTLANFVRAMRRLYSVGEGDAMPAITTIAFDLSVPELYLPMLGGGTTPLLTRETAADGVLLARALDAVHATVLQATPATYRQMLEAGWTGRPEMLLLCGAEAMSRDLADRLLPLGRGLWNFYGPTETTVWSTAWRVEAEGPISVGRPIANTRIYLLDSRFSPVPLGSIGEVCIGGEGVARGYFRRPELTAERFVPDPLSGEPGARLYRTGDLARYRPGGLLEYSGRADHQVKLRGFRIELGEIEARLRQVPGVSEAVVLLREDRPGDQRLTAYLAVGDVGDAGDSGDSAAPEPQELRRFLRQSLPEYMVPAAFVALPRLPRNANGKIDRRSLPSPEPRAEAAHEAPATPGEELLAGIWCEVLGTPSVGRSDNFFERGGHSLLATRLVVRLHEATGVELPVREVFQHPTLEGLAAVLEERRASGEGAVARPPLVPVPRDADLPLSFAQERLWFIDQLMPGTPAYDVFGAIRIAGDLSAGRMADAFAAVVGRHEALRTSFAEAGGRPAQRIAPAPSRWELPLIDLSALPAAARQQELERRAAEESLASFDLARGPLLRTALIRLAAAEHALFLNVHHIVSDAWSIGILVSDLAAFATGQPLPGLPVQYADYAAWQRGWLQGEELERQLAYWRERLAGAPVTLELPTDRPRPVETSFRGGSVDHAFPPDLGAAIVALAGRQGATAFMTVLAAWGALLARLSGQPDLLVGTAVANRERPELERLVGLFINTLPLRVETADDPRSTELLSRVRRTVLDAFAHREVPLEKLIEALQVARDRSRQPLVQVLLTFINTPPGEVDVPGLSMAPMVVGSETAKFDLTLAALERDGHFGFRLEYASDLFDGETAARWMGHLQTLLAGMVEDPERPVSELPLLSPAEREQVLVDWNRTAEIGPAPGFIHERFWQQAARTPGATALVWNEERWTYADLAGRADRLASRLRRLGVGPEVRVGVFTRRSPQMVLAVLAVLRAGGAYVPLDPAYPGERLAFLLADSGAPLVLTQAELNPPSPGGDVRVIAIDAEEEGDAPAVEPQGWTELQPENLAYLIYTSGSTGEPKGVMIRHGAAAAFVEWALGAFAERELAGVLASTSLNFDLSVFELFVPLAMGGAVILADDVLHLPALPAAGEVTLVNTVPSALTGMLRLSPLPSSVATVNLAGEPLPASLAEALWQQPGVRRVLNLYGPSEDTTYSTWAAVPGGTQKPLIGRPVGGGRAYLLDRSLRPVPPGVPGEIFLGGAGLARGYLSRPGLTAERFVPDPFAGLTDLNGEPGARLYRTGDLARWRADGELEFLGRTDFQVKVRGFRIEPGEVEAAVSRHDSVRACAVLVRTDPRGESRLVAYVVPAGGQQEIARDLRRWLRGRLPDHLVPSAFVPLQELPVTAHGKLDRDALPEPAWGAGVEEEYVAPATPLEETMVRICAEVLGLPVERVGVRDNFFVLGGHSLLATQLIARLRDEYQIEVSLEMVFDAADLRELADRIMERELGEAGDMLDELGDLSPEELQELLGRTDAAGEAE